MKHPFTLLTKEDVEILRRMHPCVPNGGSVIYSFSDKQLHNAWKHLKTLYIGKVTIKFAGEILLLNEIY